MAISRRQLFRLGGGAVAAGLLAPLVGEASSTPSPPVLAPPSEWGDFMRDMPTPSGYYDEGWPWLVKHWKDEVLHCLALLMPDSYGYHPSHSRARVLAEQIVASGYRPAPMAVCRSARGGWEQLADVQFDAVGAGADVKGIVIAAAGERGEVFLPLGYATCCFPMPTNGGALAIRWDEPPFTLS